MTKILRALLLFVAIALRSIPASADVGQLSQNFNSTTAAPTAPLQLAGQASCNIFVGGTFSVLSETVQISTDAAATNFVTATNVGTAGVISAAGTFGGSITLPTVPAPTAIRINVTSLTGTNVTNSVTCNGQASGGGAAANVNVHDGTGNSIGSTTGALNVQVVGGSTGFTPPYSGIVAGQTATASSFLGSGCIANSTAPTPTAGQFIPCSANLNSAMRVDGSAVTQPVSGTITAIQPTAANFLAQISQPTASLLNATVVQPTASLLNATVTQVANSACNLQGTAGSFNLTCKNAAGTTLCTTNASTDTCTMNAVKFCGLVSQNGTNQTGGVAVYDTTGTTTATNTELYVTTTTSLLQAGQIAAMQPNCVAVTSGKILITLTGGTTGPNGDSIWFQ